MGIEHSESYLMYREKLDSLGFGYIDIVEFSKMAAPVTLSCTRCGSTWTFSEAKRRYKGCPYCDYQSTSVRSRESMQKRLDERGLSYISIEDYISGGKAASFRCSACGHVWEHVARDMVERRVGCPECYGTGVRGTKPDLSRNTMESVQRRLSERYPDIEIVSYGGEGGASVLECHACGTRWEEKYLRFIVAGKKIGCRTCYDRERNEERIAEWQERISAKYTGLKVVGYRGSPSSARLTVKCEMCGERWERDVKTLTESNDGVDILCEKCNPRTVPGKPKPEIVFRHELESFGDTGIECVSFSSYREKALFRCANGHEWMARPYQVSRLGTGCPVCKAPVSFPEMAMLYYIANALPGTEVLSNAVLELPGGWRCRPDILIPSMGLVVEYDGFTWHEKEAGYKRDREKEQMLSSAGIRIVHFREVRGRKGRKRFYSESPYFVEISCKKERRYIRFGEKLSEFLSEYLGLLPEDVSVDLMRDAEDIRRFHEAKSGDRKRVFSGSPEGIAEGCMRSR